MSDSPTPSCPACGQSQLHWALHRTRARGAALTLKTIEWECRHCGQRWVVPTRPQPTVSAPPAG